LSKAVLLFRKALPKSVGIANASTWSNDSQEPFFLAISNALGLISQAKTLACSLFFFIAMGMQPLPVPMSKNEAAFLFSFMIKNDGNRSFVSLPHRKCLRRASCAHAEQVCARAIGSIGSCPSHESAELCYEQVWPPLPCVSFLSPRCLYCCRAHALPSLIAPADTEPNAELSSLDAPASASSAPCLEGVQQSKT
jgi:hypothetical protein